MGNISIVIIVFFIIIIIFIIITRWEKSNASSGWKKLSIGRVPYECMGKVDVVIVVILLLLFFVVVVNIIIIVIFVVFLASKLYRIN